MNPFEAADMATELAEMLATLAELSFHPLHNAPKIDRLRATANAHAASLSAFLAYENFGTLA